MELITLKEWALSHDVPYITAARWAKKSLIEGAQKFGRFYAIPADSLPPKTKTGNPNIKTLRQKTLAAKVPARGESGNPNFKRRPAMAVALEDIQDEHRDAY